MIALDGKGPREAFVAARRERWDELEKLLGRDRSLSAADWSELARLYRSACADLARAQGLGIGDDVERYLDELAGRAHNQLYGGRQSTGFQLTRLVGVEIPREIRANGRYLLASALLFYGPFIGGIAGAMLVPSFASTVLPPEMLQQMEQSYSGEMARGSGQDAMMAGFYVMNNVGIAFRCFATGALAGLGSIFYLAYNGLVLGTTMGFLVHAGHGANLLSYVAGHSAWELTGVVVSGQAGLKLGWALVDTGGRTRSGSVRRAAPSLVRLVLGATTLLLVAASIEGFWSAGPAPLWGKVAFGCVQVGIVAAWIAFGGRGAR